jgi:hypothetical protein
MYPQLFLLLKLDYSFLRYLPGVAGPCYNDATTQTCGTTPTSRLSTTTMDGTASPSNARRLHPGVGFYSRDT